MITSFFSKKRTTLAFVIACMVLILTWVFSAPGISLAERADELRQEIEARNSAVTELEKEIAEYRAQLNNLGRERTSLENTLQILNTERRVLLAEINVTEQKIQNAEYSMEKTELEIQETEKRIDINLSTIADTLRRIDENAEQNLVRVFLNHDNIADFWDKLQGLEQFQTGLQSQVAVLRDLRDKAEKQRQELKQENERLLGLRAGLRDQHVLLENRRQEQDELLRITANEETAYQKIVEEKIAAKKEFEQELAQLEDELRVALDPSKLPSAGSNVLQWPVKEQIRITQRFGTTADSGRLYASGTHNGIDIGLPRGTELFAATDGVVIGTGDTDIGACLSYGKWITIRHDNGLSTLYAHLDHISVAEGQRVEAGERIGYSGNTGYSTGPHLHFTVYASEGVRIVRMGDLARENGRNPGTGCEVANAKIPVAPRNAHLDPESFLP